MTPFVYLSAREDYPIDEIEAEKYRKQVGLRERAQEDWKSWTLRVGGEIIAMEGPEFKLRVPADALKDVAELHKKHFETSGQSISVGIGTRLSEADDSLEAAQKKGADTVMLYGPEVKEVLAQKEQLNKADPPQGPQSPGPKPLEPNSPSAGGGFMSPQQDPGQGPQDPGPIPDQQDPHEVLGALASQQGQKDQENQAQQDAQEAQQQATGDLKSQLIDILRVFKERGQELETLSQQDPDMYKALTGMVQVLIAMSRDYFSQAQNEQVQKAEHDWLLWGLDNIAPNASHDSAARAVLSDYMAEHGGELTVHGSENPAASVRRDYGTPQDPAGTFRPGLGWGQKGAGVGPEPTACLHCGRPFDAQAGDQNAARMTSSGTCEDCWDKHWDGIDRSYAADRANAPEIFRETPDSGTPNWELNDETLKAELMPGGKGDGKPDSDFDPEQLKVGTKTEMEEHGLDEARAKEVAKDHLTEDPAYYKVNKAAVAMHHHVVLPVGSNKDPGPSGTHDAGKIKVQTEDGKTKWRSVRAGIVLDPKGVPVSSRNPQGR